MGLAIDDKLVKDKEKMKAKTIKKSNTSSNPFGHVLIT